MITQLIKILQKIMRHPSNKGQVPKRILIFFSWQIFKRFIGFPVLVKSCNRRFLAYPDCTTSSMLLYFNIPESTELNILKSYCQKGETVFFDIGANIGFYSIVLAEDFMSVHAFEPNPEAIKRLKENSMLNSLTITANNIAVSDKEGVMYLYAKNKVDPTAHLKDVGSEDTVSVSVVSLDKYISQNKMNRKIVVKIDVEGQELKVLKGALENLRLKQFSIIQFESLNEEHFASICEFVKPLNYSVYVASNSKLVAINKRKEGVDNYYLLPVEN